MWTGMPVEHSIDDRLAEFGAAKVYVADGDGFTDYVTAPKAEQLAHLVAVRSPAAVLIASTRHNTEVAGRLAVKTNSGLLTDAVGLTAQYGKIVAEQSAFGGATIVHSAVRRGTPVITVRPNSAAPEPASAAGFSAGPSGFFAGNLEDAAETARVDGVLVVGGAIVGILHPLRLQI